MKQHMHFKNLVMSQAAKMALGIASLGIVSGCGGGIPDGYLGAQVYVRVVGVPNGTYNVYATRYQIPDIDPGTSSVSSQIEQPNDPGTEVLNGNVVDYQIVITRQGEYEAIARFAARNPVPYSPVRLRLEQFPANSGNYRLVDETADFTFP
jgi:hypothetical protein